MTSTIAALTFGGKWKIFDKTLLIPLFLIFKKNSISWGKSKLKIIKKSL